MHERAPHGPRHELEEPVALLNRMPFAVSTGWPKDAPRHAPESLTFALVVAWVLSIFAADSALPEEVRLHGLYVFPLAIAARYCAPLWQPVTVLLLTTALQVIAFTTQPVSTPSLISDVLAPLTASVLILLLARAWRLSYLRALDLAALDPLTGLGNRRAWFAHLEAQINRQRRYGGTFSLAVLDLDGFKALNDTHGHGAGDEALRLVAQVLRARTRQCDSLARIGGDEFGILLPDTDGECSGMLHELCVSIARRTAAAGCAVTSSMGCATFRSPPASSAEALQLADEIMYQAKLHGKNRLMLRVTAAPSLSGRSRSGLAERAR
jgi:diguanylate cyclase (GGDEF)-like protein